MSKPTIDAIPDADVGKGIKAALGYFENFTVPELDPLPNVVFCLLKTYIDDAYTDYRRSVANGQKGAGNRWGENDHINPVRVDYDDNCPF